MTYQGYKTQPVEPKKTTPAPNRREVKIDEKWSFKCLDPNNGIREDYAPPEAFRYGVSLGIRAAVNTHKAGFWELLAAKIFGKTVTGTDRLFTTTTVKTKLYKGKYYLIDFKERP